LIDTYHIVAVKNTSNRTNGLRGKRSPNGHKNKRPAAYPACITDVENRMTVVEIGDCKGTSEAEQYVQRHAEFWWLLRVPATSRWCISYDIVDAPPYCALFRSRRKSTNAEKNFLTNHRKYKIHNSIACNEQKKMMQKSLQSCMWFDVYQGNIAS
ncbi:hypothetical protein KCV07_g37, partial [Aureobasidium melanogenum]